MSATAETSAPPPRWPWLDRWFEPPWRALLTWGVLYAVANGVIEAVGYDRFATLCQWPLELLGGMSHITVPLLAMSLAVSINFMLLYVWFQPLVLRLSLGRSAAWLGVILLDMEVQTYSTPWLGRDAAWVLSFLTLALGALVFRGWRSRPWMVVVGSAALAVSGWFLRRLIRVDDNLWAWEAMELLYAAILLYGTRRLPR